MKYLRIKTILAVLAMAAVAMSCNNDDDDFEPEPFEPNFLGTFMQNDQMGRPGINTVFTTGEMEENNFNTTIPAQQVQFQPDFEDKVEALYAAYSQTAGTTLTYEDNILGLDLPTLTTALSIDVLQVTPDAPTSYFTSPTNFLTGRQLQDDVIDVSLILLFGGNSGARFDDMPNLVSDNVDFETGSAIANFPYLAEASF
jgi:hypothetical protein